MLRANNIPKNSAEFIQVVKQQNKLADDTQIIEDSLLALSKRVVQIQATDKTLGHRSNPILCENN